MTHLGRNRGPPIHQEPPNDNNYDIWWTDRFGIFSVNPTILYTVSTYCTWNAIIFGMWASCELGTTWCDLDGMTLVLDSWYINKGSNMNEATHPSGYKSTQSLSWNNLRQDLSDWDRGLMQVQCWCHFEKCILPVNPNYHLWYWYCYVFVSPLYILGLGLGS